MSIFFRFSPLQNTGEDCSPILGAVIKETLCVENHRNPLILEKQLVLPALVLTPYPLWAGLFAYTPRMGTQAT